MTTINFEGQTHVFPDDFSQSDIASALSSAPKPVGQVEDIVKGAGGAAKNVFAGTLGLPGDAAQLALSGAGWLAEKMGVSPERVAAAQRITSKSSPMASADIHKAIEPVTGPTYETKTPLGGYAKTGLELAPMVLGPGGMIRKLLGLGGATVGHEEAGRVARKIAPEAEPYAKFGGAIAGGLLPGGLSRLVTPFPASAERTAAANVLRGEGVTDLTAGQVTGRPRLKAMESELGGGRGATLMENQGEQFTSAALHRAGINANRATPEAIDGAFTRLGTQFETIGGRNTINIDRPFVNDVAQAQADYNFAANPLMAQVFNRAVDDVVAVVQRNNGIIPGDQYNAMRSRLGTAARGAQQDTQLRQAFYDLQHSLDDAMERSMARAGNTADVAALRETRNHYRNLLTIERASTMAGENAAMGLISPAALRSAEINTQGRRGYARGTGDFSELSRAGVSVMSPLPNSGTPMRTSAYNLGMSPTGATAGAALGSFFGPVGAGAGAVAGGYTPRALGSAAVSGPGRAYLGNQVLANSMNNAPPWLQQAMLASLMLRPQLPGPR